MPDPALRGNCGASLKSLALLLSLTSVFRGQNMAASNNQQPIPVNVTVLGDFSKRGLQGESCLLPKEAVLYLLTVDNKLVIELALNPHTTQAALQFIISPGVDGKTTVKRIATTDSVTYGLYYNDKLDSSIMITCPKQLGGEPKVEGTLMYKKRWHILRAKPSQDGNDTNQLIFAYELVPDSGVKGKYDSNIPSLNASTVLPESSERPLSASAGKTTIKRSIYRVHRREASSKKNIFIDCTVVVAYDVYKKYFDESKKATTNERNNDAKQKIRQFFANIIAEVDVIYNQAELKEYKINIRLLNFIIAESAEASGWTEKLKEENGSNLPLINVNKLLEAFVKWLRTTTLPPSDYVYLFSFYEFYNQYNNQKSESNVGQAGLSSVCNDQFPGHNSAVVQITSIMGTVETAVHEMAHGWGAQHDGRNNECQKDDAYIMAPSSLATRDDTAILNYNRFSPCSIRYIEDHIKLISSTTSGSSCLFEVLPGSAGSSNSSVPLGQLISVDDQCRFVYGYDSGFCVFNRPPSDICLNLFCTDPLSSKCWGVWAARGTSCGNKKWCINGQCLFSEEAPEKDESCFYGDSKKPPYSNTNKLCRELYEENKAQCYNDYFRTICCETCKKLVTNISGCEYGDRYSKCPLESCSNNIDNCCLTCSKTISSSPTTTTSNIILFSKRRTSPPIVRAKTTASSRPFTVKPTTTAQTTLTSAKATIPLTTTAKTKKPEPPTSIAKTIKSPKPPTLSPTATSQTTKPETPTFSTTATAKTTKSPKSPTLSPTATTKTKQPKASIVSSTATAKTTKSPTPPTVSPTSKDQPPIVDVNAQCQKIVGGKSVACLASIGKYGKGPESICSGHLYCTSPSVPGLCSNKKNFAPDGTICGNHKICLNQTCVNSLSAPEVDQNCPLGDMVGDLYNFKDGTCSDLATRKLGHCNKPLFRKWTCCKSCAQLAAAHTVCPYGDVPGLVIEVDGEPTTCAVMVQTRPSFCTQTTIATKCCLSCQELK